ncbi:hypothetical protein JTE90_009004 [Oedothorax gibbosus]|uniref:Secreted protein n=1 Tax=Oedothorax gibbosus TaxID=931172 RepID=A0AAV6VKF6_9ARAC|nr:hypothetical protein JTE90_009004 [Oedothorax gibbosus]
MYQDHLRCSSSLEWRTGSYKATFLLCSFVLVANVHRSSPNVGHTKQRSCCVRSYCQRSSFFTQCWTYKAAFLLCSFVLVANVHRSSPNVEPTAARKQAHQEFF